MLQALAYPFKKLHIVVMLAVMAGITAITLWTFPIPVVALVSLLLFSIVGVGIVKQLMFDDEQLPIFTRDNATQGFAAALVGVVYAIIATIFINMTLVFSPNDYVDSPLDIIIPAAVGIVIFAVYATTLIRYLREGRLNAFVELPHAVNLMYQNLSSTLFFVGALAVITAGAFAQAMGFFYVLMMAMYGSRIFMFLGYGGWFVLAATTFMNIMVLTARYGKHLHMPVRKSH